MTFVFAAINGALLAIFVGLVYFLFVGIFALPEAFRNVALALVAIHFVKLGLATNRFFERRHLQKAMQAELDKMLGSLKGGLSGLDDGRLGGVEEKPPTFH